MTETRHRDWNGWRTALFDNGIVPTSFLYDSRYCNGKDPQSADIPIAADCECTSYPESDCIEWNPQFRNTGSSDSELLSELHSLDLTMSLPADCRHALIYALRGVWNDDAPYKLERFLAGRGMSWTISSPFGAKTGEYAPFINIDLGGYGLFCSLGWPGRWRLTVEHTDDDLLRLTGGLEQAELHLHPGEAISFPKVLLMFWKGDRTAAHNRFRKHILEHHSPTCDGEPAPDLLSVCTWGGMKTENHLRLIEAIKEHEIPFNCYWVDAGWYGSSHETEEYQSLMTEDWYFHVGDWRPNTMVHPDGLKPISDAAHAAGMKFLLWFEVERAVDSSPWMKAHPEWYFRPSRSRTKNGQTCSWRVFNFGHPEATQAMTEHICQLIEENGIDVFRLDCNMIFNESWDDHDTPGRVGMAEIRYVEGLLEFWDTLQERFPHLLFDLVQRRDLESIGRSLDLSRTDTEFLPDTDVISSQCAQYGLSHFTPLSGTAVPYRPGDDYAVLSGLSSSFGCAIFPSISREPIKPEPPADYPWEWLKRMLSIHRRARPFFRGDFYPLLDHVHPVNDHAHSNQFWTAMQFHREDLGAGMVAVYRRPESPFTTAQFKLQGLQEENTYILDQTEPGNWSLDGTTLNITLGKKTAAVLFYCSEKPDKQ